MSVYRFSVSIAAPQERVFDLWTNVDRCHEWIGGVTRVTDVSGPAGEAGSRYTVWFGSMRSRTEILEASRPQRLRTRFANPLLRGESMVSFEPDGSGTRLTQEFRTEGLIPAIAARVFATGSYRGSFSGELNAFAKLAERDANGVAHD
jgi:uncharacterized protein YndB with AHSA1/START domain